MTQPLKSSPAGKAFVDLNHARNDEQKKLMEQIKEDGVCPFCPDHLRTYHPRPIIEETDHWFVTTNMNPYEGTSLHLLFILKRHITKPSEMIAEETVDLFKLIGEIEKKEILPAGAILLRFGDTAYTGGSVDHFHAHLLSYPAKHGEGESVKVKVGYKNKIPPS